MTVTAEKAQRVALTTLGFDEFPPEVPGLDLINDAGEWLIASRSWNWLDNGEALLDFVADQSYVELPADCATVSSVTRATDTGYGFCLSTLDAISAARSSLVDFAGYRGAVSHTQGETGAPVMRLEIYPTPTAAETGALRLRYLRGWATLTADDQAAQIPRYMDAVYLEAVRRFALGYHEEHQATLSQRLGELMAGNLYLTAMRRDTAAQLAYGRISGGAAQRRRVETWYSRGGVSNPS